MVILQYWERLNEKIITWLLVFLETDKEDEITKAKVKYTLMVLLGEFEKIFCLCIIFGIFQCMYDFVIAFLALITFRIFTGGIHRNTMLGCLLQSVFNFATILYLSKTIWLKKTLYLIVYVFEAIVICGFVPIQSSNRIWYTKQQQYGFKKKSLIALLILIVFSFVVPQRYYNIMMFAVLIQILEVVVAYVLNNRKGGERKNDAKLKARD